MKIIAKVTIRAGGKKFSPGAEFEIDDETGARLIERESAKLAPAKAIDAVADGSLSPEVTGDGTGDVLPEVDSAAPPAAAAPAKLPKKSKR